MHNALFIVIEGLDGAGKTSSARLVARHLQEQFPNAVRNTFEPHDPSCGGLFIRQVLTKRIRQFDPRVLALAFAANRLDHCERVIRPWLAQAEVESPRIVISDRYYLSSLVYQSSADFGFDAIMELNEKAIQPDVIFFLNVSNEVCYQRMQKRNLPQELFETKLSETRQKYLNAIEYLNGRHHQIIEIDGNGTLVNTVTQLINSIKRLRPEWGLFSYEANATNHKKALPTQEIQSSQLSQSSEALQSLQELENKFDRTLDLASIHELFIKKIEQNHFKLGKAISSPVFNENVQLFELTHTLPLGIEQRGILLLCDADIGEDFIMKLLNLSDWINISDFIILALPFSKDQINASYQREPIVFKTNSATDEQQPIKLSPKVKYLSLEDIM